MIVKLGYGKDFKQEGTIRIRGGKVVMDPISLQRFIGDPTGVDPKKFMSRTIGRFRRSSTVVLELEEGENF